MGKVFSNEDKEAVLSVVLLVQTITPFEVANLSMVNAFDTDSDMFMENVGEIRAIKDAGTNVSGNLACNHFEKNQEKVRMPSEPKANNR